MKYIPLPLILLFFCLLPVSQTNAGKKQADDAPPNILFILIDDMGWKDIACAGSTYYETPNIDKLASEGMRFINAYSPAPVCTPTRGAIYSGKCPARTQLTTVFNGPAGPDDRLHDRSKYRGENDQYLEARHRHALPRDEFIIPQALAEAGYETAFFGKWHVGECPGYYPDERGFHIARGYRKQQQGKRSHWMKDFTANAVNMEGTDQDAYVADVLTGQCVDFIKANRDKPWMAVLSHYLVHSPVEAKPEKLAKYESKPKTDQNNPGYAAMVESVDESVGRLIQSIRELGLEDNTMVIFTSDNGGLTPGNTSNYPLMGGKSFPFEAGMKVPFMVKWPGKIKTGISEQRVVGMDIYPTMLGAAGLPLRPEQHVDGLDLMPLLTKNESLKKRPIIFHFPHYTHASGPFSSIIEDDWKLIKFYNDEQGAYLLYNLADKERILFESRLKNAQKPNIVCILADDRSYYDLSALGQKHFQTPNLDDLMHEGLFFHEAYAGSPENYGYDMRNSYRHSASLIGLHTYDESNAIVALYDIFPTVCEIADLKPPETDGKSFLPILTGEFPEEMQLHDYLYWENGTHNPDMQSARFRNWFVYRDHFEASIKVFDLSKDITCSINLAASRPDIVQEALSIFEEAHAPSKWYSNPDSPKR